MRASRYNIYIKIPNSENYILIHGYTGAVDIVNVEIINFLKEFDHNSISNLDSETIKILLKRGYLTDISFRSEKSKIELISNYLKQKNKISNFLFVVTYKCNLKCNYCFQKKLQKNRPRWTNTTISKEYIDYAFKAMKEIESSFPNSLLITLYGGEPLLKDNVDIIEYLLQKGICHGYRFNAITNGVDLKYFLPFLKERKIQSLQITLDGPPSVHDLRRFDMNQKGTFIRITRNITKILDCGVEINLRINVDSSNLYQVHELFHIFHKNKWNNYKNFKPYIIPLEKTCNSLLNNYMTMNELLNLNNDILFNSELINLFKFGNEIYKNFSDVFFNGKLPKFKSTFCGSQDGMFIFDPFGDIYVCLENVGDKKYKVGNYITSLRLDKSELGKWHNRTVSSSKQCLACRYALFCGGGCTQFAMKNKQEYFNNYCKDFSVLFHKYVLLAFQAMQEEHKKSGKEVKKYVGKKEKRDYTNEQRAL